MDFVAICIRRKWLAFLLLALVTAGCDPRRVPYAAEGATAPANNSGIDVNAQNDIRRPAGKEVSLSVKISARKKAEITVYNNSDVDVYTTYIPGGDDRFAVYAILGYEKMDPVTGEYESWRGGDFGTGLNALKAHDYFKDGFVVRESGTYRVSVRYIVDANLAERINRLAGLSDHERAAEEERIAAVKEIATNTIVSEPFSL